MKNNIPVFIPSAKERWLSGFPFIHTQDWLKQFGNKRYRKKRVRDYLKWRLTNSLKNKSLIDLKLMLYNVETDIQILALGSRVSYKKISRLSLMMEIILDSIRINESKERKSKW